MKINEIRQLSTAEIKDRVIRESDNLVTMRFQLATSQLTNTSLIAGLRRDIARMQTVLTERLKSEAK
jgi:large subunit ribosomal protein L29